MSEVKYQPKKRVRETLESQTKIIGEGSINETQQSTDGTDAGATQTTTPNAE